MYIVYRHFYILPMPSCTSSPVHQFTSSLQAAHGIGKTHHGIALVIEHVFNSCGTTESIPVSLTSIEKVEIYMVMGQNPVPHNIVIKCD